MEVQPVVGVRTADMESVLTDLATVAAVGSACSVPALQLARIRGQCAWMDQKSGDELYNDVAGDSTTSDPSRDLAQLGTSKPEQ